MTRIVLALLMLVSMLVTLSACAGARHVFVQADAAFVLAVAAADDAEFKACETHIAPFTPEVCAAANPKFKQALLDAQAVTAALQATPKNGVIPKDLPSLLANLTAAQAILVPLSPSLVKTDVGNKIQLALMKATAILTALAGVQ